MGGREGEEGEEIVKICLQPLRQSRSAFSRPSPAFRKRVAEVHAARGERPAGLDRPARLQASRQQDRESLLELPPDTEESLLAVNGSRLRRWDATQRGLPERAGSLPSKVRACCQRGQARAGWGP